jgi:hypothetical protein
MTRILTWYRSLHVFAKCLLIFCITTLLIGVFFLFNLILIDYQAKKVMDPIERSDVLMEQSIDLLPRPAYVPLTYFQVLKAQQQIMKERKSHHWKLASLFFRNYYSILFLTIILSCVGALVLFAVLNKGWSDAGITLQAFFLTIATALAFVGFFPVVFKQQDNFANNMTYYENYSKGELVIYNQLSGLQNPFKPEKEKDQTGDVRMSDSNMLYRRLDSLVKVNNDCLSSLTNYVLSIDADQAKNITINNVLRQLQSFQKPAADSTK